MGRATGVESQGDGGAHRELNELMRKIERLEGRQEREEVLQFKGVREAVMQAVGAGG